MTHAPANGRVDAGVPGMLARSIKRPLIRLRADYGELTGGLRGMPTELRSRLTAYFEPYNRELYRWLGREFDWA